MKWYPYDLPASLLQQMTAILSAVESTYRLSGVDGRSDFWQIMVVDPPRSRKFYTPEVPIKLDALWGTIYLPWRPSPAIVCRLIVHRFTPVGTLSVSRPLGFHVLENVVVFDGSGRDVQDIVHDARVSIREQFLRISRSLAQRSISHTPRLSPETRTTDIPYASFDHDGVDTRPGHSGFTTVTTFYREYTGSVTGNFHQRRREHTLPVNSHHVYMYSTRDSGFRETYINPPTGSATGRVGAYTSNLGTSEYGPTIPTCAHLGLARDKAIAKLVEKTHSGIDNLAQDFIQMRQTTDIVGNTVFRLSGAIRDLRRGNFSGAMRQLWSAKKPTFRKEGNLSRTKTLAENWLELQYGWKPLIADVQGVIAAWQRYVVANRSVQTVYASASTETWDRQLLTNNAGTIPYGSFVCRTRSRVKFSLRYKVDDHLRVFLSQTGFTNPINLAWEIIPYSFVVDWFLPIGPFLENLSSWNGLVFLDGSETKFTRQECDYRAYFVGPLDSTHPDSTYTTFGTLSRDSIRLDRSVLNALPTLSGPSLKSPVSTTHVLNGLALLRAAFGDGDSVAKQQRVNRRSLRKRIV